jgi:GGDEF domain-containing protein
MTVSAGATLVRDDDKDGAAVLARAGEALDEAKHDGGDAFVLRS